ncbi:MAG: hemerythrin-like metal-binding protein [Gammaproteobacteria bacterium]|nr:MAG: hemerythrin-like metal-binding protein [Gammaproteobacteria bacterium]
MSLIEWREEYCTGIEGVDFEHEELIRQINEVYKLIENQVDKGLVIDCLGEIYGSISAHFALEEQMMLRHDYDHYPQHRADHERLLDDIRDITEEFEQSVTLDDDRLKKAGGLVPGSLQDSRFAAAWHGRHALA